jgi:hypothetical protein
MEDIEEVERMAAGEYRAPQGEWIIRAPQVIGAILSSRYSSSCYEHSREIRGHRSRTRFFMQLPSRLFGARCQRAVLISKVGLRSTQGGGGDAPVSIRDFEPGDHHGSRAIDL